MNRRPYEFTGLAALSLSVCFAVSGFVSAQVAVPKGKPTPDQTEINLEADKDSIRVDTALVDIAVSVFNRDRKLVPNLNKDDFVILESGIEQKIEYFANIEQPFTVVLLMDLSGSMEFNIEGIKSASLKFIDQLKPDDRIVGIVFNENIRVLKADASLTNQSPP